MEIVIVPLPYLALDRGLQQRTVRVASTLLLVLVLPVSVTTFDAYHCTPSSSKDIGPSGHNDYNIGPDNSAYVNQKTS